jgi:redox-sensitive bicupin YhaK (pirin superfamily)
MIRQSPAIIYKSQQRSQTVNEEHRLYATFNYDGQEKEVRTQFGALTALNDETLAPQQEVKKQAEAGTFTVLIPLVGALEYNTEDTLQIIIPGEVAVITFSTEIIIKNPYEGERINYLYITFCYTNSLQQASQSSLNLDIKNTLHLFLQSQGINGFMAIFNGREEAIYKLVNNANGLFAFVINGAFEVQGRLLESRDGLALWDNDETDIEALSENAILLLFEVPLTGLPHNTKG